MISIAMTTYNGEKYIKKQIDSILTQTIKDFELIICDDCSSDNTRNILTEYANKDFRIKLFFNQKNLGFKKNFEEAISHTTGDFIALSDQDDIWASNHLEVLQNLIGNADIACGNALLIDENDNSLNLTLSQADVLQYIESSQKLLYRILGSTNCFQGASMLIRKSFFEKALPIPENVHYHDAWFAACACCSNGINYTFDQITYYRQHSSQITADTHQNKTTGFLIKRYFTKYFGKHEYNTDRFDFFPELQKRYSLSSDVLKILYDCNYIQLIRTKRINFFKRLSKIHIFSKNYSYIFTRKDSKYKIIRILKLFI